MPSKKRKVASKSSARRKKTGRGESAETPGRLKLLAGVLIVLAVAGVGGVKFFQSPRGHVVLLDAGFHAYYEQVQEATGDALKGALEEFGLRRGIGESAGLVRADGKRVQYRVWDIPCDEATNFVRVNVALSKAAGAVGARVRKSEERDRGRTLVFHVGSGRYDTHRVTMHKGGAASRAGESGPTATRRPEPGDPSRARPRLAIVIDDFGYTRNGVAEAMIDLDLPLTISILPGLPYSQQMLERALARGRCTLLHLPMEADEEADAGIPAVTTAMGPHEIAALVARYVESLPGIRGVNNHQGSRATADEHTMTTVLETLLRYNLFFLDSLTSPKSVAYNVARDLAVPAARNNVFLDDDTEDADVVEGRLRALVAMAERDGSAIGIGHPHAWTLEALESNRAFLKNSGVELVNVSELVN